MSLTSLVEEPEVRERLSWCVPEPAERVVVAQPKIPKHPTSSGQRESMLGTAVDYALRFGIERNNPHAVKRRWVAEHVAELGPEYAAVLRESRQQVDAHVSSRAPWRALTVARRAVMLAKLDPYIRSSRSYVPEPPTAYQEDVLEVFQLVRVAPMTAFSHPSCVHLNPRFGRFSTLVGGADADLIVGTELIDVKLSLPPSGLIAPEWARQLVGYAMLARWERSVTPTAPEVRTLSIYFAREAVFWSLNPGTLLHSRFNETARWLRTRVEQRAR